jgi:cytochrome c553
MKSRLSLLFLICAMLTPVCGFADTAKPEDKTQAADAAKPADSEAKPASDAAKPADSEAKPASDAAKPAEETEAAAKPAEVPAPPPANGPKLVGNIEAGKGKTQTCVACHGPDGNSTVPNWPKIAGQYENYLVKQLREFRLGEKGPRYEPSMYGMVANLSDQDIADLAAYYASEKQTLGKANSALVEVGQRIYRGGNLKTGVTACLACHGPEGLGNDAANFPKLSGQHATYIDLQLHAFRDGKRKNSPNGMMESISHRLNDDEIKAVSSYIEGLR